VSSYDPFLRGPEAKVSSRIRCPTCKGELESFGSPRDYPDCFGSSKEPHKAVRMTDTTLGSEEP
jgi:hypothetical protein